MLLKDWNNHYVNELVNFIDSIFSTLIKIYQNYHDLINRERDTVISVVNQIESEEINVT